MRRLRLVLLSAFLVASCSAAPPVIPTRNLQDPIDMTFVCLSVPTGSQTLSGQSMDACHARTLPDPLVSLGGPRNLGTFGFVANSSLNELAVADMDRGLMVDLSPETAGYGMLPVGGNPEALAASHDGCWVVTANRSSCDFTLVDPSRLLVSTFSTSTAQVSSATGPGDVAHRLVVQTGSGRALHTSTGEIAFLPSPSPLSPPSAKTGTCQDNPMPRAVATFPSCDLVALLDFSFENGTATIVSSYYVRGGFQAAGTEPVCPSDCAPAATSADSGVAPDGGGAGTAALDGGTAPLDSGTAPLDSGTAAQASPTLYLQPLALVPDGTRVYVASMMDTAVTSLDISDAGLANPLRLELAENPGGVTRLRLAVDSYAAQFVVGPDGSNVPVQGQFLNNRGKFLYAFTRDDSVRVVEVEDNAPPQECDVNIILQRNEQDPTTSQLAPNCFPVGSAPRRPLAQGPGIRIPTFSNPDSPPPAPRDLAFADLEPIATDANVHSLSGQYGFLLGSNGLVYAINLAPGNGVNSVPNNENPISQPDLACTGCSSTFKSSASSSCNNTCEPPTCPSTVTATNSFRDLRTVDCNIETPIAISIAPQRTAVLSNQSFATTASFSALDGPLIKSFSYGSDVTPNWLDFPDLNTIVSRSWDVTWEGVLPGTDRRSGIVQGAPTTASAGVVTDAGGEFCTKGVQAGDIVMFPGCTQNSDCQPDDQFSCQATVSGANSMCLPIDGSASAALVNDPKCSRLMGSRMRYEVTSSSSTSLVLGLKLDEVPKTKLNPCTQDSDCRPDVEHGQIQGARNDGGVGNGFECLSLNPQDTLNPDLRCVERCSDDSQCRPGHVCGQVPGAYPSLCVEAPPIDPTCFPQPMTRYQVQAGKSYMVYGSSMPSLHTGRVLNPGTAAETCAVDTSGDVSLVNRIPLSAPECPKDNNFLAQASVGSTTFVQQLTALPGSNPCLYSGPYHDGDATESPDAGVNDSSHIRAFFQNPQIRFVLANLDEYAGDLLSIHFELQYGFIPLTVQIPSYEVLVTLGTRILTGPTKTPESPIRLQNPPTSFVSYPYLYVVDQGRSALTPASRGQVLRINPRAGSNEIATFDTTISGSTPFQLQ